MSRNKERIIADVNNTNIYQDEIRNLTNACNNRSSRSASLKLQAGQLRDQINQKIADYERYKTQLTKADFSWRETHWGQEIKREGVLKLAYHYKPVIRGYTDHDGKVEYDNFISSVNNAKTNLNNKLASVTGLSSKIIKIESDERRDAYQAQAESLISEGDAATDTEIKIAKYNEAITKFNDAERITTDQAKKTLYNNKKALMHSKIGAALESEGNATTNTEIKIAKYNEALSKFSTAESITTNWVNKTLYKNNKASVHSKIDKIQRELDVAGREAESLGDTATNAEIKIAKYNEALSKFSTAESMTTGWANKTLYKNNKASVHNKIGDALISEGDAATDTEIKIAKYNEAITKFSTAESITTDRANKTLYKNNKASLHNKIGNALLSEAKYTEALQQYETAIRIDPGNTDAVNGKEEARESINKLIQEADSIGELIAGNISRMDDCIDYINRDIINFDSEDKNNPISKIRDLNTNLPEIRELILSVEGELKSNISKRDTIISILNNNGINYENKIISNPHEGKIEDLINSIDEKENEFNLEISDREEVARQETQDWEKIDTGHDYNDLSLLLGDLDGGYMENH